MSNRLQIGLVIVTIGALLFGIGAKGCLWWRDKDDDDEITTGSSSIPAATSSLTATAISSSQINLTWTDVSGEDGYKIERKTGTEGTYNQITMVGADVSAYTDTGLATATTYYYRVRAFNTAGDSHYSNEASVTTTWAIFTIDTNGGLHTGEYNFIAVDSNNKVHISYQKGDWPSPHVLQYATNAGGDWATYTIDDSVERVGEYNSIAVTGTSPAQVHISYIDYTNCDLKYATNVSGSWVITPLDTANICYDTSIGIDKNNKIHISYIYATADDLRYITDTSGSGISFTVEDVWSVWYQSLAIDSNNKVHLSYLDAGNRFLRYITNASGEWVKSIVDDSGNVNEPNSIAIDKNDKVHISYYDATNKRLMYATNVSGDWITSIIDNLLGEVGTDMDTSIAIDSNNKVHITYYTGYWYGNLRYATNVSSDWVISTIDDPAFDTGWFNSIAIDSDDKVHISYNDYSNDSLKYATNK